MINHDDITGESTTTKHNSNWPQTMDYPTWTLVDGGWGPGKINDSSNLANHQPGIDKTYFDVKDPCELKYQSSFNKCEKKGMKHFENSKGFIEVSNNVKDFYEIDLWNLMKLFEEMIVNRLIIKIVNYY